MPSPPLPITTHLRGAKQPSLQSGASTFDRHCHIRPIDHESRVFTPGHHVPVLYGNAAKKERCHAKIISSDFFLQNPITFHTFITIYDWSGQSHLLEITKSKRK